MKKLKKIEKKTNREIYKRKTTNKLGVYKLKQS